MNPHESRASSTRVQQAILALAFMGAVTACLVLGNVLAERLSPRVDITASGEHRLSPRTLATLENLEGKYRVVVATGFDGATRRSRQRLQDVLDQMVEAAGEDRLSTSLIDVNGAAGQEAFEKLQRELAERERGSIEAHAKGVRSACVASRESAAAMEKLAGELERVRDSIPASEGKFVATREALDAGARQARANAKGLVETAGTIEQELGQQEKATIVANTPPMASALQQQLSSAAAYLQGVADGLVNFANNEQAPKAARDRAGGLVAGVRDRRAKAAMEGDALARLPKLDILRVASVIQSQSVALVIGPGGGDGGESGKGMNAIPIDRLVPPDAVLSARAAGGAGGDSRRDAEELLGTALGMLSEPARPIVVFVHGEASRGLVKAAFGPLVDGLQLRGIDSEEWACVAENEEPSVAAIDPAGSRPVVYAVIGTNSARGSGGGGPSGVERSQRLGRVLGQLIAEGKPVLVSVFPSTLPAFGQTDPIASALLGLGIEVDAGRPILREATTTAGRRVDAFARLTSVRGAHPVLRAIGNLPTFFEWPMPMKAVAGGVGSGGGGGFVATKLFEISDAASWAESEWMAYAQIPMESHVPGMAMAPMIDSAQDSAQGPWTIAMAAEKRDLVGVAGRASTQRAIVVGSSRWFVGDVVNSSASVDGRLVRTNPGNAELFESSVLWLAGQDELIAQSVASRSVALVRPLKPGTVTLLRWVLMAGLPMGVLGLGAAWRFWRG